jgi:uncharacterized protein with FMN-binding domain
MSRKMSPRLVALSAAAIAGIYLSGYIQTEGASAQAAAATTATPTAMVVASSTASQNVPALVVPSAPARPTVVPTTTTTSGYRDGTYQGSGTVRFGSVSVAVTIEGGRISNVALTRVTTSYPAARIAALPAQVVTRQSAQVDRVSGATSSTQAFQQAVLQALSQARASSTSAGA